MSNLIFYQVNGEYTKDDILRVFNKDSLNTTIIFTEGISTVGDLTKWIKKCIVSDIVNVSKFLNVEETEQASIITNKDNGKKNLNFHLIIKCGEKDGKVIVENVYYNEKGYECNVDSRLSIKFHD